MTRALAEVGLFLMILGASLYVTGLKERLAGPAYYTWALKQNRRSTDEIVQRFEGRFNKYASRLCQVGRWIAVCGLFIFIVGYAMS